MILKRTFLSSRHYRSDDRDAVDVEIRWSRSLGGFRRDGEIRVGEKWFELRTQGTEVWLVHDEQPVGYAKGAATRWQVDVAGRSLRLTQPVPGAQVTDLTSGSQTLGQVRSADKLIRTVLVNIVEDIAPTYQAFVAAIAIRGWRETLGGMQPDPDDAHGDQAIQFD
ncbi:MAG: hypothetical protein ACPGWS_06785 [Solirubrobacterales bacterium]